MYWRRRLPPFWSSWSWSGAPQGSQVKPEPQTHPIRRMTTGSDPSKAAGMAGAVVAVCSRRSAPGGGAINGVQAIAILGPPPVSR
jgi:hypothetical protein